MQAARSNTAIRHARLWTPAEPDRPAADVRDLIPHRPPFLFLDRVVAYQREPAAIVATLAMAACRTMIAGHFPGDPVLPGVLQIEAAAQAAAALWSLLEPRSSAKPRLVAVRDCEFRRSIGPDSAIDVVVTLDRMSDFFATADGQLLEGDAVCAYIRFEVCLV